MLSKCFSAELFSSRLIAGSIVTSFLISLVVPPLVMAQTLVLPIPGMMVTQSPAYIPVMTRGLKVHPENPLLFDFIVDVGDSGLSVEGHQFKAESEKLIKYFLASLTVKEDDQWVNLSPCEKDRMIPQNLGKTELGRDMLAQDYILKQLTASLIYPEEELGKEFWAKVYEKAQAQFGSIDVPVDTFNKVWITADKARVLERNNTAYVVGAHLKVMLESDYEAMSRQKDMAKSPAPAGGMAALSKEPSPLWGGNGRGAQELTKQVMREVIIPQIEKEVNEGKNFSQLRQIFYAMILSTWYKRALKNSLLNHVYSNKSKTNGVENDDPAVKEKIYVRYLEAYRKGVFNYVKEETNAAGETIPRKYFSGGIARNLGLKDHAMEVVGNVAAGDSFELKTAALVDASFIDASAATSDNLTGRKMRRVPPRKLSMKDGMKSQDAGMSKQTLTKTVIKLIDLSVNYLINCLEVINKSVTSGRVQVADKRDVTKVAALPKDGSVGPRAKSKEELLLDPTTPLKKVMSKVRLAFAKEDMTPQKIQELAVQIKIYTHQKSNFWDMRSSAGIIEYFLNYGIYVFEKFKDGHKDDQARCIALFLKELSNGAVYEKADHLVGLEDHEGEDRIKEVSWNVWGEMARSGTTIRPPNIDPAEDLKRDTNAVDGGIDFNGKNLTLDVARDGNGSETKFDPAMVAHFEGGDFTGFVPIILKVTPLGNIGLSPGLGG